MTTLQLTNHADKKETFMGQIDLEFYNVLFADLDPASMQKRFLQLLLNIQNVYRGSIWIRRENRYECIQSLGSAGDTDIITGATISVAESSIVGWVMENGEMTVAEAGKDPRHYRDFETDMKLKSAWIIAFPLILKNGEVYGVVQLIETDLQKRRVNVDPEFLQLLQRIVDMGAIALGNALNYTAQLEKNQALEQVLAKIRTTVQIIGQSRPFIEAMKKVRDFAQTEFPVLITGESGTGKDLIATALHDLSSRQNQPFIVQNCCAIPETLLESELFGYRKGAFTGATDDKIGLLQAADGGTVFLDEIGDMSLHLQARILRVIQNCEIKPLGDTQTSTIDIRIICATNKDLSVAVRRKEFREDLFYRINVLPLHLPPLRERKKDLPLLLNYFFNREARTLGVPPKRISKKVLRYLINYPWEGNIREVENFVKYIISTTDKNLVRVHDIPEHFKVSKDPVVAAVSPEPQKTRARLVERDRQAGNDTLFDGYSWKALEKDYVAYLLNKNKWSITRAAQEAQINRSTFASRMARLGIHKN